MAGIYIRLKRVKFQISVYQSMVLSVLWLVFMWSPYPWSPGEITPLLSTFCGYFHCVHYFYVPWLIMTSQWVMTLLRMPHCSITVGNDIVRDICMVTSQWVMTLLCVHIMASQWIMTLLWTSFARYYFAKLWYCCLFHQ